MIERYDQALSFTTNEEKNYTWHRIDNLIDNNRWGQYGSKGNISNAQISAKVLIEY